MKMYDHLKPKLFVLIISFCVLGTSTVIATSKEELETILEMRQASAFFEAKEYQHANEIYQNMLQEPLSQWQRAVIMCNLGYVLLANKQLEQAITTFKGISFDHELGVLVADRVSRGIALSYLYQALDSQKYSERVDLLDQALNEVDHATQTHCLLENAEGQNICTEDVTLFKLKLLIQYHLAISLQQIDNDKLTQSTLKDGLPLLQQSVEYSLIQLKFLSQKELQKELKGLYRDIEINNNKSLLPLWMTLKKKLMALPNDIPERSTLFDIAEEQFENGLNQLELNHLSESRHAFEASLEALKKLNALPPPPSPTSTSSTETTSQPQSEQQTSTQSAKQEPVEQVLRFLLEMERDDTSQAPEQPVKKKEIRPW